MLPAEYACINPEQILRTAMIPAALAAGQVITSEFSKRRYTVTQKSGKGDLVTDVDQKVSNLISSILSGMFPEIPIMDEEKQQNEDPRESALSFIVDPLDGTLNFIHGNQEICVSIGLLKNGKPLAGAVYQPLIGDLYTGLAGTGAWKNGNAIGIGRESNLAACLIGTGIPYNMQLREQGFLAPLRGLLNRIQEFRVTGSAASSLCYVASGQLSGFFEYGLSPWDVAGGAAVILGAGGVVIPIHDNSDPIFGGSIIAGNAKIGTILKNELSKYQIRSSL